MFSSRFTDPHDIAHFEGTGFYVGSTYHGVILIYRQDSHYYFVDNLSIWGNYKLIYDRDNNCIWADVENKFVLKLILGPDNRVIQEEQDGITNVFETGNGILFSNDEQLLRYNGQEFYVPDQPLIRAVKGKGIMALDFNREGSAIACIQGNEIRLEVLLPDGNIHSYNTVLRSLAQKIVKGDEYLDLDENVLRVATDRGVTIFDINYKSGYKNSSRPVISSMTLLNEGHRKWFFPYPEEGIVMEQGNKDLRFRFSINKSEYDEVEYRYRLAPGQSEWSDWSARYDEVFYPQVKGGSYTLHLQSRINGGNVEEAALSFSIEKFWYQTLWLALPVLLALSLVISAVIFLISRVNRKKMQRHEQVCRERDALHTLQLKNEQLLQYTEIISHKNEFLNNLKSGLESMRNNDARHWVNKISDEVNNEKKEFLFFKLFSEIHQDFIGRLTEKYPGLTSNDIRILSFIRINLENKEISNLMNISQRSLDTNRYRLRKKLNLDHATDLNQFIRDF